MEKQTYCSVCQKEKETIEHSLFWAAWFVSPCAYKPNPIGFPLFTTWWLQLLQQDTIEVEILETFTCWQIWKERNRLAFENVTPDPLATARRVYKMMEEQRLLNSPLSADREVDSHPNATVRWVPPLAGFIKINCDVAWKDHQHFAAIGVVGRDSNGNEKLRVVLQAVLLAQSRGFASIIVRSDSQIVVTNLSNAHDQSLHASAVQNKLVSEHGNDIVKDVYTLLQCTTNWYQSMGMILVSLVEGGAAATCKSRTCNNGDGGELKLKWSS
ncbi:uncharacterized protein LOC110633558 [Hevea brasiliensis]|uniref:uncharacterized protein LOC110633558 n=1 Tax=Hevea brasiliensis TaxID=3981 RepID=UPI0025E9AED7|nr:uncharacterized protein LOC110633558 [Hevea brasiliensis]